MDDLLQRIIVNPGVAFGKPMIRGLRYFAKWLLELLSSGMSHDEILANYENLEAEDIYAVLAYATKLAQVKPSSSSIWMRLRLLLSETFPIDTRPDCAILKSILVSIT